MNTRWKIDLLQLPGVRRVLRSRWPQFVIRSLALGGFLLAVLAGLLGTPVGSRNFAIVLVWIAWWALLMLLAVPLLGRGWCSICPIPMPGEWLQHGSLLGPVGRRFGLGWRWPKKLRNIWLQNFAFGLVALFSAVVLTQPGVSAVVLGAFLVVALGVSLVFERRSFCRYLCPVGGFIGLYSQVAPLELRVKDTSVCAAHTQKTCYTGNPQGPYAGFGCPWGVFPAGLAKNNACGLCMECLRTCPHDNLAVNLRGMATDLENARGRKLDEAYKAFIMLGSALVYSAVMLGPWGWLKTTAYSVGTLPWLGYAIAFLILVFGLLPGVFLMAVGVGRLLAGKRLWSERRTLKADLAAFAYALVPLGLAAWMAFSLSFVFTNLSYVWPALSDPFGWGWNLLGTRDLAWTPYLDRIIPILQVMVLVIGVALAARVALRTTRQVWNAGRPEATRQGWMASLPVLLFCLVVTAGLVQLLIA